MKGRNYPKGLRLLLAGILVALTGASHLSGEPASSRKVYAYVTAGDNQTSPEALPIDSQATVEAIFDWLFRTHQVKRVYWRGGQADMWIDHFEFRPESPFYYDLCADWWRHLYKDKKVSKVAIEAAHQRGMEIYLYTALFDYGAQGDVGGGETFPFPFEDRLRIEHREWCPTDRWGERLAAGPIEFCEPAARQALLDRYLDMVARDNYDGIFFYTYVENWGARYPDEFGFNPPIVEEFKRRHGVDIRREPFSKQDWYKLRGECLTSFLRDLHAGLAARGKKLSIALYPPAPNFPEPWNGSKVDIPGAGMVYMDWENWVREGIVDELFVWWRGDQKALLTRLLEVCRGKPVEVAVAARNPFGDEWDSLSKAGVVPVGVWASGYHLDRDFSRKRSAETLRDPDWRWRWQTLIDIGEGRVQVPTSEVARLVSDPHVLVRREALVALKKLGAREHVGVLEPALTDEESSVRVAAALGLEKLNTARTPGLLLNTLVRDGRYMMKEAVLRVFASLKDHALPDIRKGLESPHQPVREVCVRALSANGFDNALSFLLKAAKDPDYRVRYYALSGLGLTPDPKATQALIEALDDETSTVQLWAARKLG
ncbi:MAG TPA: HEAT repeat domain-containing protein, partial [Acidobacteriota bacterium]|nr:HEAT repeat domain-containing protein [Acidobacteriota bacterium]